MQKINKLFLDDFNRLKHEAKMKRVQEEDLLNEE